MDVEKEITHIRWRIEVQAALHEVNAAAIMSIAQTVQNRDAFLVAFDQHIERARVLLLGSDNSDLAIAALDGYSASLRQSVRGLPKVA